MKYDFNTCSILMSYNEYNYLSHLFYMSLDIYEYDKLTRRCSYKISMVKVPTECICNNWRMLKLADCAMLNKDAHLMRNIAKTLRIKQWK